jgi:tetratricopeptide (TPR) repeat protein
MLDFDYQHAAWKKIPDFCGKLRELMQSNHPSPFMNYGMILYADGFYADALRHFEKAEELNSAKFASEGSNPWITRWIGRALLKMNKLDLAEEKFREVFRRLLKNNIAKEAAISFTDIASVMLAKADLDSVLQGICFIQQGILIRLKLTYSSAKYAMRVGTSALTSTSHLENNYWMAKQFFLLGKLLNMLHDARYPQVMAMEAGYMLAKNCPELLNIMPTECYNLGVAYAKLAEGRWVDIMMAVDEKAKESATNLKRIDYHFASTYVMEAAELLEVIGANKNATKTAEWRMYAAELLKLSGTPGLEAKIDKLEHTFSHKVGCLPEYLDRAVVNLASEAMASIDCNANDRTNAQQPPENSNEIVAVQKRVRVE